MEDNKILELYFARDEDAICQTALAYGGQLKRLADNILHSEQDTQECVSDTYLRAWNTIPPQRPRHFFGYLAKICRHLSLDRLDWQNAAKRKAEVVSLTQEMECCVPDDRRERESRARELGAVLDAFLRSLSTENRLVFLRRYWYADTIGEIAARYGISESAVQMRLRRTRTKLEEYLKKEGIAV